MRIAFVSQPIGFFSWPPSGSLEIWTYEVVRRLAHAHEVTVYARRAAGQSQEEVREGVTFRRFGVIRDVHRVVTRTLEQAKRFRRSIGFLPPYYSSPLHYLTYGAQVTLALRETSYDVAHLMNFTQLAPMIRRANPEMRVVLHMQCEWLTQLPRWTLSRRLRSVDRVLGCSRYIADTARNRFPEHSERFGWVHNGVGLMRFSPSSNSTPPSPRRFVYVGRISPEKGIHLLLEAFAAVAQHHPDVELDLIGPPWSAPKAYILDVSADPTVRALSAWFSDHRPDTYAKQLREMLPADIAHRVRFRGGLPYNELAREYRRSTALVFPSVWQEPFGMPIVEAMACGIPVIATRGGGIPEILDHGRTGLLVERGSAAELALAMDRVLANAEQARLMGEAGRREAVLRFSWDAIADQLEQELAWPNARPPTRARLRPVAAHASEKEPASVSPRG